MVNQVILVGKYKEINEYDEFKKVLLLEIQRPFKDGSERIVDIVECVFWNKVFLKDIKFYKSGDLLAIKGRLLKLKTLLMHMTLLQILTHIT